MSTAMDAKTGSAFSAGEPAERAQHRRAVESIIWRMRAVNYELMYRAAARERNGDFNPIIHWSRRALACSR